MSGEVGLSAECGCPWSQACLHLELSVWLSDGDVPSAGDRGPLGLTP